MKNNFIRTMYNIMRACAQTLNGSCFVRLVMDWVMLSLAVANKKPCHEAVTGDERDWCRPSRLATCTDTPGTSSGEYTRIL